MATEEKKEIEDATLKKNKKRFKNSIKTIILITVLVLVADLCILLALNKLGVVDINEKISNIPIANIFVNEQVEEETELSLIKEMEIEIASLKKQIQLKDSDINSLTTQRDELSEKNKLLEEKVLKFENKKAGIEKLVQYYSKMKPKQAAEAFNRLEAEVVLEILHEMPEGTAATILDKMLPEKVAEITKEQKSNKK